MSRFNSNRWWVLILALVLSVSGVASMPAASFADTGDDGSTEGGTVTPPSPQGAGDPDSPSGSGKNSVQSGGGTYYGTVSTPGVGDAATRTAAPYWMRVRLALGMLKYFYLRF